MLFINDKNYSVIDFVKKIEDISGKEINLEDLKKNTSFTRNEAFKHFDLGKFRSSGGIKVPSRNQGDDISCSFRYFDGNETHEVRYANRNPYRDRSNGPNNGNLIYAPKYLDLPDDDFGFDKEKELDLAVYIFVNPSCSDSPFHSSENVARFYHESISKEVSRKNNKVSKLQDSLSFVDKLADSEVKIFAKGLGLTLNKEWGIDDIKTELKDYAINNTSSFYVATQMETVKFDGAVQDAIDNMHIKSESIGDTVVWSFNFGKYKSVQITSVPRGVGDTVGYLKNHIKENIAQYDDILVNIRKESYSNLSAESYLRSKASQTVPDSEYTSESDTMLLEDIKTYEDAKTFLELSHPEGRQSSPAKTKKFLEDVLSGIVTNDVIGDVIWDYLAKSGVKE